jgi:two-component system response regulator FlrC
VNVRIVATSNRNLFDEVKKGTFREDLMFRLNVMNLNLPPLRDRTSDILPLAEYFLKKFSKINSIDNRPLDPEVLPFLTSYQWPGNVRELENTMHRAVLLAAGHTVGLDSIVLPDGTRLDQVGGGSAAANVIMADTPESATQLASRFGRTAKEIENDGNAVMTATGGGGLVSSGLVGMTVAEVERDLIIDTLKHCLGNRTHAATTLGISIRTLRNKLKQYTDDGISVPQPGSRSS